jgi:tetratricopeptide (TPR) repeat protein
MLTMSPRPLAFIAGNTPALDDCTNEAMLREQRPAPAVAKQSEITKLGEQWRLARSEVRKIVNAGTDDAGGLDDALARMSKVGDQLETLGASGANETTWLGSYLVNLAIGERSRGVGDRANSSRVAQSRTVLTTAIRRAEAQRDNAVLATALFELARLEFGTQADRVTVDATLAQAKAATLRAGNPNHVGIATFEAQLAIADGRVDDAVNTLRQQVARGAADINDLSRLLATTLTRAARHDEAIAAARNGLTREIAVFGDIHIQVAELRLLLAETLEAAGRRAAALDELEEVAAIYNRIGVVSKDRRRSLWTREAALARALGNTAVEARVSRALAEDK